jgi:hypothetical protein
MDRPSDKIGGNVDEDMQAVPPALSSAAWYVGAFVGPTGQAEGSDEARKAAKDSHSELWSLLKSSWRRFGRLRGPIGEPNA